MKKLIAAAPVTLALALALSACSGKDAASNTTVTNEVLIDENATDGNLTTDNLSVVDDAAFGNSGGNSGDNALLANEAAPATNGL